MFSCFRPSLPAEDAKDACVSQQATEGAAEDVGPPSKDAAALAAIESAPCSVLPDLSGPCSAPSSADTAKGPLSGASTCSSSPMELKAQQQEPQLKEQQKEQQKKQQKEQQQQPPSRTDPHAHAGQVASDGQLQRPACDTLELACTRLRSDMQAFCTVLQKIRPQLDCTCVPLADWQMIHLRVVYRAIQRLTVSLVHHQGSHLAPFAPQLPGLKEALEAAHSIPGLLRTCSDLVRSLQPAEDSSAHLEVIKALQHAFLQLRLDVCAHVLDLGYRFWPLARPLMTDQQREAASCQLLLQPTPEDLCHLLSAVPECQREMKAEALRSFRLGWMASLQVRMAQRKYRVAEMMRDLAAGYQNTKARCSSGASMGELYSHRHSSGGLSGGGGSGGGMGAFGMGL